MSETYEDTPHPKARDFVRHFFASYGERRADADKDDSWRDTWGSTAGWTSFMLRGEASVIAKTARRLRLCYREGEPLRLDAVFCDEKGKYRHLSPPFPVLVAIEHENKSDWFDQEVRKLCLVRCPLKIGITYTLTPSIDHVRERESIRKGIVRWLDLMKTVMGEEAATEYAFLVGSEEALRELKWYALFSSIGDPQAQQFVGCDIA